MLSTIQARDLSIGDEVPNGVVVDITTGPTGLLDVEVAAYPGSLVTNIVTPLPRGCGSRPLGLDARPPGRARPYPV